MSRQHLGKRILSLVAVLTLVITSVSVFTLAPSAEDETPIYLDTSYSFAERAADLVSRMTLDEKASQLGDSAGAIPRLGVPAYKWWSEALHGVARSGYATSWPTSYGIAQTWNRDLVQEMMTLSSDEARAYNNEIGKGLSYWSPTINMSRDPRWGRAEETYGEDPYLTAQIGASFAKGLEGTDEATKYLKSIATIKHYALNNTERFRHSGSSDIDDATLREYYTRAYKDIVREMGIHSLMTAYNRVNGTPSAANTYLLETLLRRTFGFTGYVTSDCGAINDIYTNHKWVPDGWDHAVDQAESAALCLLAGNDLECGGVFRSHAKEAVQRGLMTEDDIDVNLVRLFTARMETGEFDAAELVPYRDTDKYGWDDSYGSAGTNLATGAPAITATDYAAELALKSSEEAVALLKNEAPKGGSTPVLPLDATKMDNIVIVGENELVNSLVLGDYSGTPLPENVSKPFDGIKKVLQSINPNATLTYVKSGTGSSDFYGNFANTMLKDASGNVLTTLKPNDVVDTDARVENGGGNFGYVYNGTYAVFNNVSVDNVTQVTIMASGNTSHGTIEIHMDSKDGPIIGRVETQRTTSWTDYQPYTGTFDANAKGFTGKHTLYLVCNSGAEYQSFTAEQQTTIRNADAVIAYVGTRQSDSGEENDRRGINFPRFQSNMVQSVAELNPNTVVYVCSVAQMNVEEFKDAVPAIFWATYNGQAQGEAAGNLIFGKANPSGHLTFTWYSDLAELGEITDYTIASSDESNGRTYQFFTGDVSYPFGHGLSYSNFEYSNVKVSKSAITPDDTITVTLDVKNNSAVDGSEVVQVYVSSPKADKVTRPAKQLKGFEKVFIPAGETKSVSIDLKVADWYFWDEEAGKNIYDQGAWKVEIGASSGDIRDTKTVNLSGALTPAVAVVTAIPSGHVLDLSPKAITTDLSVVLNDDSFYDLSKATIKYTSSNEDVAKVDANGNVTSVAPGVATITVTATVNGTTGTSTFPVAVLDEISIPMITVNGQNVEGFNPSVYQYEVVLEGNVKNAVVAVPGITNGLTITQAESLPGTATVTLEMGDKTVTYTLLIRTYHAPVSTDFTKVNTLPADWRVYSNGTTMGENPDNWTLSDKGLTITTEYGDLYQNHNDAQNIFIQAADGDWVADTKIVMSDTFKGGYQQIGFLVFQDEDNYIKFSYESGNRIKVVQETGSSSYERQPSTLEAYASTTLYYRIQKSGDKYTFYYSKDGGVSYLKVTDVTANFENPSIGLSAVNSFSGTPTPIQVTYEYVNIATLDDCTCTLDSVTFNNQVVDLQSSFAGATLQASAQVGGTCPIDGHKNSVTYTYALAKDGENTAGASISNNRLVASTAGVVDVTVTATLPNGLSKTATAKITVKSVDPTLVAWFFQDEKVSGNTHLLNVNQTLTTPINIAAYAGKNLYLEFDAKVVTTHTDPAPVNSDWVKYVVNGGVSVNGSRISSFGYNGQPRSFSKNDTWTSLRYSLPEAIVAEGLLTKVEWGVYNDTSKYKADANYIDNGIDWNDGNGVVMYIKNARITTDGTLEAADRTALNKAIADAEAKLTDGKTYTADTLAALNTALAAAKNVAGDADQAAVDAAAAALTTAIAGLKEESQSGDTDPATEVIFSAHNGTYTNLLYGWMFYTNWKPGDNLPAVKAEGKGADLSGSAANGANPDMALQATVTLTALKDGVDLSTCWQTIGFRLRSGEINGAEKAAQFYNIKSSDVTLENGTFKVNIPLKDIVTENIDWTDVRELNINMSIANDYRLDAAGDCEAFTLTLADVKIVSTKEEDPNPPVVNKEALDKAIADAEAKLTDGKTYTADTLAALNTALDAAKALADDADQAAVDAAAAALNAAIAGLKEEPVVTVLKGDVNGNGEVTAEDALMALQAATGKINLNDREKAAADVDTTAGVQANDALLILQFATKKIASL